MKIIIADDEPIAVESLVYMINKNFDNLEIAGTARTGKDAIELAIKTNPDIVIMDINMPGINGLDAIKRIKDINSNVCFLVITAYDYFDYAVESVALGVEDYLLKPVKEKEFVKTLKSIMDMVEDRSSRMQGILDQQEKLKLATPAIEASFIYSLCTFGENKSELNKYSNLLGYSDIGGYVLVLEFISKGDSQIDTHILGEKAYDEIRSILKLSCDCIVGPIMANQMIVYAFDDEYRTSYEQKVSSLKTVRKILRRLPDNKCSIFIGVGSYSNNIEDAKTSYNQAYNALHAIRNEENKAEDDPVSSHILHEDDIREISQASDTDFDKFIQEEFYSKIPHEKMTYLERKFDEIFSKLVLDKANSLSQLKNYMIGIVVEFSKRWEDAVKDNYSVLSLIMQASSEKDLYRISKQFVNEAIDSIYKSQKQKVNSIIEVADEYIEKNYNQSISLESVAKEVNLSSYYFSRFYKEETGINFSDKLSNVRIAKAKELLAKEDLSIKDVAFRVGFTDPNYFSKTFKKMTGLTASEYRN